MEKLEEIIDIMDELNIKGNIIIDPYWSEKSYSLDIEDLDGWVSPMGQHLLIWRMLLVGWDLSILDGVPATKER